MSLYIRLGEFQVVPGQLAELTQVYARECVPRVRATPGNVDCYLLAPVADTDPVIACTVWESDEAARAYEQSGAARDIVARVRPYFAGPPTLRTYRKD